MEYLNGPELFDSMFRDDVEASKLAHLPGVAKLLDSYPYLAFTALLSCHHTQSNDLNRMSDFRLRKSQRKFAF